MKLVLIALLVFVPLVVSAEQPEPVALDASPTPQPESAIVNVFGRGSDSPEVRLEVRKPERIFLRPWPGASSWRRSAK